MAQTDTYRYPLLPSESHVRLLRIDSTTCDRGEVHENTVSSIHVFHILDMPPYHALSYTWGQADADQTIHLPNGLKLSLTENLKIGLPYVLAQCECNYLFVDQLCIDQKNPTERSKQVALMAKIFSQAQSVLIWLGVELEHQEILAWLLRQLGDAGRISAFRQLDDEHGMYVGSERFENVQDMTGRKNAKQIINDTLSDILNLPWFCRVWVIQEAVLASQASFIIGSLVMSPLGLFEIFALACDSVISGTKNDLVNAVPGWRTFLYMMQIRARDGRFQESFIQILSNHRTSTVRGNFHASDERDYIYAVLGLQESDASTVLMPDYTLPISQVFTQAATYFVSSMRDLSVLNLCDGTGKTGECSDDRFGLPSWVPDWSLPTDNRFEIYRPGQKLEFSASAARPSPPISGALPRSSRLIATGRVLSTVREVFFGVFEYLRADFTLATSSMYPLYWNARMRAYYELENVAAISSPDAQSRLIYIMLYWALRQQKPATESTLGDVSRLISYFQAQDTVVSEGEPRKISEPQFSLYQQAQRHVEVMERGMENKRCGHRAAFESCSNVECREAQFLYWSGLLPLYELETDAEFFATSNGAFGFAHRAVSEGDVVAILHGYDVPAILRSNGNGQYQYVTGCYPENAMYGEAVTWAEEDADEIVLI